MNNNTWEEEEGDEDYDEEDEEEEEEEEDYQTPNGIIGGNMSANLKKMLGIPLTEEEERQETDWKPPSFAGLTNSDRIVPTVGARMQPNEEAVSKFDNPVYDDDVDDEEDDEDDDDIFPAGLDNTNVRDDIGLSPNLRILLGLEKGVVLPPIENNWMAPQFHGLQNSKPLVQKYKDPSNYQNAQPLKLVPIDSNDFMSNQLADNEREEEEDDEEDDDGDDDYDDNNYGEDDGDYNALPKVQMSASLMKALGLETKELETDWKPPITSGLDNSDRLIPLKY